jgi:glycerate 2-kinase
MPSEGISLEDKQQVTGLLLNCGADIIEINTIRKHLSGLKGGRLGQFFAPVTVISLILSDVIGNDLATIASGPTYPDPSTFADAWVILERYHLENKVPHNVRELLKRGIDGYINETPKSLPNCHNYIIGDNRLALEAMADKARDLGMKPLIITSEQKGEPTDVANLRASEIIRGQYAGYDVILIGGETTPILPANAGKGGRNQHCAAVSMLRMADLPGDWLVCSIGTDGSDYLPDVTGAIVDRESWKTLQAKGIDSKAYLASYNSNTLLKYAGNSLVVTGETGTNVGDVILYILGRDDK